MLNATHNWMKNASDRLNNGVIEVRAVVTAKLYFRSNSK
jgi:hypothetical protein